MKNVSKNDPYKELYESAQQAFVKVGNMIVWVAKRTLTANEYEQFLKEFAEEKKKPNLDEIISEPNKQKEQDHGRNNIERHQESGEDA